MNRYLKITIGAFIMGIGQNMFLIPNKIAAGGVSGIATILEHTLGISPGLVVIVINIPLFYVAYKLIGKKFIGSSIWGTLMFSLSLEITDFYTFTGDYIIVCIAGSVLMGIGLGIVLMNESSTGGTEIGARLLEKYYPHISVGKLILAIDSLIIAISAFVFKNFDLAIYATLALFISSVIVDKMVEGVDFAKAIYVISDKNVEISKNILTKMERGVTGLKGMGMYSKKEMMILLCVVRHYELATLKKCIFEVDDKAFLITSDVREVMGKGFRLL